MDKVELLLKIVPMTNPIKFKKLGSIFLEAELLSAITLCCCLHPQSQHPSLLGPHLPFCNHIRGKRERERDWTVPFIQVSDIKGKQKGDIQIKIISRYQNFWRVIDCPYTAAMFSHSLLDALSVPRDQWDCRKQIKIALNYATLRPRQCWMQKLSSNWWKVCMILDTQAPDFGLMWQAQSRDRKEERMNTDHRKCPTKLQDSKPSTRKEATNAPTILQVSLIINATLVF